MFLVQGLLEDFQVRYRIAFTNLKTEKKKREFAGDITTTK